MYIGIDLGGTNTAAALVGKNGEIIKRAEIPTNTGGGAQAVTDGLLSVCKDLLGGARETPLSIGIGVPGLVNSETGEVVFAPNLPLDGVSISSGLKKAYGCPILVGNDANCAALGETVAGGAAGAKDVVFITLGTGVGGGIIVGGRLHTGLSGAAGEIGHIVIVAGGRACGCGRNGCWESYGSATGLIKTASEHMEMNASSSLWELCGGSAGKLNGRLIFGAFRDGDAVARAIVEQYIEHLAIGIANIINIFDPEMVCIGGGISGEWDSISAPLLARVDAEKISRPSTGLPQTQIVRAKLGNDAGIIGAAMLGADR